MGNSTNFIAGEYSEKVPSINGAYGTGYGGIKRL
jgi:hypothetical protein